MVLVRFFVDEFVSCRYGMDWIGRDWIYFRKLQLNYHRVFASKRCRKGRHVQCYACLGGDPTRFLSLGFGSIGVRFPTQLSSLSLALSSSSFSLYNLGMVKDHRFMQLEHTTRYIGDEQTYDVSVLPNSAEIVMLLRSIFYYLFFRSYFLLFSSSSLRILYYTPRSRNQSINELIVHSCRLSLNSFTRFPPGPVN